MKLWSLTVVISCGLDKKPSNFVYKNLLVFGPGGYDKPVNQNMLLNCSKTSGIKGLMLEEVRIIISVFVQHGSL